MMNPFPAAGGLMSYNTLRSERDHLEGLYLGRVLKGIKPADLPIKCRRPNSNSSSTSRPPKCSALKFRRASSQSPTG